jgi:hypothetical protein
VHTQAPELHTLGAVHDPHNPPQPSGPHVLPLQSGTHAHAPEPVQVVGASTQHVYVTPSNMPAPQLTSSVLLVSAKPKVAQSSEAYVAHVPAGLQLEGPPWLLAVQVFTGVHVPHDPPQPSGPHVLPLQSGTHTQAPDPSQVLGAVHVPHEPPQPSGPHTLPAQSGLHTQVPPLHMRPSQHGNVVSQGAAAGRHPPPLQVGSPTAT